MPTTYEGGCHCGRVRFRVTASLDRVTYCNCSLCSKKGFLHLIVPPEQFDLWLDCKNADEKIAAELLAPAPDGSMQVYEISPAVNRVANDAPALLEPYSADANPAPARDEKSEPARRKRQAADSGQGSLF